jgi:GGDEF domain-containing protein
VLTQFAHRITALLGVGDTAARLGGDEFAVLCEDTEPRQVASIAQRLRAAAAEPFLINDMQIILSVAVGSSPAYVADPAALLQEADRRMYETKRRTIGVPVPEPRGASPTPGAHVTRSPMPMSLAGRGASATPASGSPRVSLTGLFAQRRCGHGRR